MERLAAAGRAANMDGRPALAVRRLRAALRLAADTAGPDARGRLLVSLAWSESECGRVELGFRLLDEAEDLLDPAGRPVLFAQRALLLRRNGRNDLALPEYGRAIAALSERDSPLDLVKALNNRNVVHLDAGRVGAARDDLTRAHRIARRHDQTQMALLIGVNLGCLDVLAGDLPAALGVFAAARPAYEEIAVGRLPGLAVERARALVAAGLFREADRELADATAQARAQGQEHTVADALQVRAEAALLAARPSAAARWAAEGRAAFRRRGNRRRAMLASLLELRATQAGARASGVAAGPAGAGVVARGRRLARELARLGLPEDARVAALIAARALVDRSPRAAERLVGQYGPPSRQDRLDTRLLWRLTRAEIDRAAGRPADAARQLIAGVAALHRHRARFGCLDLQTGASAHGRDLARAGLAAALAGGSAGAVHRWSERVRAQALLLPPVRPPADPAFGSALEDLRQTRHALREAELTGRASGALRVRAEALHRRIREHAWSVPGAVAPSGRSGPASLSAVRSGLGGAALVAYLKEGDRLLALVATAQRVVVLPLGRYGVAEEAVLRLRADLDTGAGRAMPSRLAAAVAAATARDAAALQAAVLDPLAAYVGDRDLVIVPTGLLMTTPWALLPACGGRSVTVTPSATAWVAARARRAGAAREHAAAPAGPMPGASSVVLVAGPGNRRGEEEIRQIAGHYPGASVLLGDAATPAVALAALDGAALAHIAAHGRHEAENALFSSLDLAGGPVLGYDLQRLARPPVLVVLSSCELGLSEVRPGDESFGMASALLAAGTATVVASVSRVADDAARDVMVRFHREITAGREPAAALAAAATGTGFVCLGA